jgi:hypothetical protein
MQVNLPISVLLHNDSTADLGSHRVQFGTPISCTGIAMSASHHNDSDSEDDFNPAPAEPSDDEREDDVSKERTRTNAEVKNRGPSPIGDEDDDDGDDEEPATTGQRKRSPSGDRPSDEHLGDSATKRSPGPVGHSTAVDEDVEDDDDDEADGDGERDGPDDEDEEAEEDDEDDDVQEVRISHCKHHLIPWWLKAHFGFENLSRSNH